MHAVGNNRILVVAIIVAVIGNSSMGAPESQPFRNNRHIIPGLIEAEDYDEGDAGAAYYDIDVPNHGANYRGTTQVDIEQRADASNGHGVGWTRAGEWLRYSVEVNMPGQYLLEIPVASNKRGGVFHLELNGKDISGPIHVPDTGSWQKLQLLFVKTSHLKAGHYVMKLVCDSDGPSGSVADIDYVRFVPALDNRLTAAEKSAGWKLLFNGRDYSGWKCNTGKPVAGQVEEGCLTPYQSGGYLIVHESQFSDFLLKSDVRWESPSCNSGIFFRVQDLANPVHTALEMQILGGNEVGKHHLGAICDLAGTSVHAGRPVGEWNEVEIRCKGPDIEVRLNGHMVAQMNCDEFSEPGKCPDGSQHKFNLHGKPRAIKDFARTGYIGLQDHGQKVWYRNIKILEQ